MSEVFIVEGMNSINGEITPQGNKNEALPILCASILNLHLVELRNIPEIGDIKKLLEILESLDVQVTKLGKGHYKIKSPRKINCELPRHLTEQLRGSLNLLSSVLVRCKRIHMPIPGGDKIGRRIIDTHLNALSALGAKVEVLPDGYILTADELIGTEILLDETSVTGTENTIIAACCAKGKTIIENAACEPHVQGVCKFFQKQGVRIEGIGSNVLTVYGMGSYEELQSVNYTIDSDHIEIGSFIAMAAITPGELKIKNVKRKSIRMIKSNYEKLGIQFYYENSDEITNAIVPEAQNLVMKTDIRSHIAKIEDAPWPSFPADLLSIAIVAATQSTGTILFHEKLFESRMFFIDKLIYMGAKIVLCDPHRALVIGPTELYGREISSPDIRAGMSLLLAALVAKGTSTIQNVMQIDRGYEDIEKRLVKLGACITRQKA